uniref:PemK-like, MazF-like toxin of type II toxin-antitoxin system n=1 Tax=Candidatus Kentrum sp. TUN TaxID=2126343 RepID=A0A451ACB5_9GAMM|nr:MAG: PemK-like, MazF-like toxin of type II toxin-antitoxin system [Candidatus Kentron sp. TUN]VFK63680.1 MAG: PemK-like, MazF-like toxin of type II toxin-antitoxin system [Candidatus Kentron sp. TUN]VFK70085.1 MAG: PemK-like, MazF-like toxin of type II toxin-antitoxin system [Candidatus Kentron sp. TUN]
MHQPSDVVLLPFPFSDLSASKKRPVLIMQTTNSHGDFLAVQITSQPGYEGALILEQDDFCLGVLPKKSFVRPEKLVTLNSSLVIRRTGKLTDEAFTRIREGVCVYCWVSKKQWIIWCPSCGFRRFGRRGSGRLRTSMTYWMMFLILGEEHRKNLAWNGVEETL